LQLAAFKALRILATDDDVRQCTCVPSAVENREYVSNEESFPRLRRIISRAFEDPTPALARVVLVMMKDVCWHQDRIFALVYEDKILPKIERTMKTAGDSQNTVYAVLVLFRQFCFSDKMKSVVTFDTQVLPWVIKAVKKYTQNDRVMEQAFGLFSNLMIRMPKVTSHIVQNFDILSLSHTVLNQHKNNPQLLRTVVQSIRNCSKDEEVALTIKDSVVIDELRELVLAHREHPQWRDVIEISRQFLRELRLDEGIALAPKWNEYY